MIDLKYHIVSIIGVFLALGLGILIGSTLVSDDIMVGQQRKMIDDLEEKFMVLREREDSLVNLNESKDVVIGDYENFSQAMLPLVVKDQLQDVRTAIIVTGGQDVPAGLTNTLALAGAQVVSQTVVLSNVNMQEENVREKLIHFYNLEENVSLDVLRQSVATSVALVLCNKADPMVKDFLEELELMKFRGEYFTDVDKFIMVGGADKLLVSFARTFDKPLIEVFLDEGKLITGVEGSEVHYSYIGTYKDYNITTIDNIDRSPGQIALVLSMGGEPGNYGIKVTADKFMPSLPVDYLGGQ
ncbi:MAG: copper transporter [Bacillota bacterium]|nr:copper transporter [Bacillota bacterium]